MLYSLDKLPVRVCANKKIIIDQPLANISVKLNPEELLRGTLSQLSVLKDIEIGLEGVDIGRVSDGYHTFDELYYHRMILFAVICNTYKDKAWKSWKHHDGTMYDDYFIVGVFTPDGDYSYHYHKDYWDLFEVDEYDMAPEWDGHKPSDIGRLLTLL